MRVLIVFVSSHGTTEKAAHIVSEYILGDVEIVDLRMDAQPELSRYDAVILGASIHGGLIPRKMKQFIAKNQDLLTTKKVGLFLCCMQEGEFAVEQFEDAFPKELRDCAISAGLFGGEFIFSKMNFFERLIVKKVSGANEDVSKLDLDLIKEFANQFNMYAPCEV